MLKRRKAPIKTVPVMAGIAWSRVSIAKKITVGQEELDRG
jgi:hypothetical protein